MPPERRRRRPSGAALLLAGALIAGVFGCELLVPGQLTNIHCTQEGAIGPPVCPTGTFCHDGTCVDGPPSLGEPCGEDESCAPGDMCVHPQTLGLGGVEMCSRTCCSSADCGVGTDLVCAALGPGKMCVPAELWGRKLPGERFAGEPCERGTDCRSGLCAGGSCSDTCCADAECAVFGESCRESGVGWMCEPQTTAHQAFPQGCETDLECSSGLCVDWPDGLRRCAEPCCSSLECGALKFDGAVRNALCVPVRHGTAMVLACAAPAEGDATLDIGQPCEKDAQCRGGRCIEAEPTGATGEPSVTKVCSDVCCTDASCGAPHLFACVPRGDGVTPGSPSGTGGQGFDLQCVRR